MKIEKKQAFIKALEELYGAYRYESALFGTHNYTSIASNLCYSQSHFTKLISGGASEAMYDRALDNIKRLKKMAELEDQQALVSDAPSKLLSGKLWKYISLVLLFALACLLFKPFFSKEDQASSLVNSTDHPLDIYFNFNEADFYKSPYLSDEEVHEYCPCSAFEGRWELHEEYIIPIPYKIPGLYYVGKMADIRFKCRKNNSDPKGHEIIGFENIENEIWFDTSKTPIDLISKEKGEQHISDFLSTLDFSTDDNFVKIADVYSCFYDEIKVMNDSIYRLGEPCGRYANASNENILREFNLDLNHIIEYIIGNMKFAQCAPISNPYSDPNDLKNGESLLSFPCKCYSKNENLGLGGSYPYRKTIQLTEQNYQSNLYCKE